MRLYFYENLKELKKKKIHKVERDSKFPIVLFEEELKKDKVLGLPVTFYLKDFEVSARGMRKICETLDFMIGIMEKKKRYEGV